MSVSASDIIVYGSANMPEDDTSTSGGAIDTTAKIIFTDIAATDDVEILSASGSDTSQTVTITGRDAAGNIVSETETLNGTTPVTTTQTFERILKIVCSSSSHGTITIRRESDDATIATMENGIDTVRRPFYDATAEASGGSSKVFYEKVFIKNTNGSKDLLSAGIQGTSDPSSKLAFDLEDATNDNNSVSNRLTAPSGGDMLGSPTFNDSKKSVPGSNLASGEAIGVWLQLTLAAGTAAAKTTYTLQVTGSTT
jgi:hypothetical protein